ncbi:MAG: stage 0 sporulation family protein [Oscillospiraceae bacterium]|jgi:cell fate regulator YaaT (PSP1 superfamily)|nr:stage 0 sporulation family protein [Oscillospiraceae bacterium]
MTTVISVKYSPNGKFYYFDPRELVIKAGTKVIVDTAKGLEFGTCSDGNHEVEDDRVVQPLRPVIRVATDADLRRAEELTHNNRDALVRCRRKVEQFGLQMKLVSAEYSFDGSQLAFYYTADGRVDFRELVKDLNATFRTRVNLRQIGVRDEARALGGLGVCGKQFCCSQFLNDFHPVSIKMAKTQGLSLNPAKISGTCGRLMCCLQYEEEAYQELVKRAPKTDAFVETPGGKGTVTSVNLLRGTAKVRLEDGNDTTLKTFPFDELDVLGGRSRRAEYQAAKAENRLAEAGFKPSVIAAPPKPVIDDSRPTSRPAPNNNRRQPDSRGRNNSTANDARPANREQPRRQSDRPSQSPQPQSPKPSPQPERVVRDDSDEVPTIGSSAPKPEPINGKNNRRPYYRRRK